MRNFIRFGDYSKDEIFEIFRMADGIQEGEYAGFLRDKTVVLFFPSSSLRTRVTFEKGIRLMGGQSILFPPETLDKRESLKDVAAYLNNWVDAAVIRHKDIAVLGELSNYAGFPVINAMTDVNHPCEILSDLYELSKRRDNFLSDQYLFCGAKGNIGFAWKEAAQTLHLALAQCCPKGYEIDGIPVQRDLREAIKGKDIICTDSLPKEALSDFGTYRVSKEVMDLANKGAILNPCPPFYRGEEVTEDAINGRYFVGYEFKKHLLEVQMAVLLFNLTH